MATKENLEAAFAGESQANRKYLAFAKKAEADGLPQVAKVLRAGAAAETVHAHAHLRVLGGVKGTVDNLKAAMAGESHEFTTMYPGFIATAEAEKQQAAVVSFKFAMAVEKVHHKLYSEALSAVEGGKDLPAVGIFVCEVCGNTVLGGAEDKCSVCGAPKAKFIEIR